MDFSDTRIAFLRKSDQELKQSAFLFGMFNNPTLNRFGTKATELAFKMHLPIESALRSTIFPLFCGGETIQECMQTVTDLERFGVITNLDFAVEAKQSEAEFDATAKELLTILDYSARYKSLQFTSIKITGIARFALLERPTFSKDEEQEWQRVISRLDSICAKAVDSDVCLFIDAEETWIQDRIDELVFMMMKKYNRDRPIIYGTWQMYRHDRLAHLEQSIQMAKNEGFWLGVKQVRGAYLEKENERAHLMGYPTPMQKSREDTSKDYDQGIALCLAHPESVAFCAATHNENSVTRALDIARNMKAKPHLSFAQLYGMGDHITFNLAHAGHKVCKYVPYGPVREVIPYLIRRAEENSSIAGQVSRELTLLQREIKRRKES